MWLTSTRLGPRKWCNGHEFLLTTHQSHHILSSVLITEAHLHSLRVKKLVQISVTNLNFKSLPSLLDAFFLVSHLQREDHLWLHIGQTNWISLDGNNCEGPEQVVCSYQLYVFLFLTPFLYQIYPRLSSHKPFWVIVTNSWYRKDTVMRNWRSEMINMYLYVKWTRLIISSASNCIAACDVTVDEKKAD